MDDLATQIEQRIQQMREQLDKATSKEQLRQLHEPARRAELTRRAQWLRNAVRRYENLFANGDDIDPTQIRPLLTLVESKESSEIFRLVRCSWSLPFTKGFGRRLRFLVTDEHNGKLIGILGLQSPPIDLAARDQLFRYPKGSKTYYINQTMDIYTLGAVPPYSILLGGKLISYLAASNEVREMYTLRYEGKITEMEGREIPAGLVALTTTSAFGRSSQYARLRYQGQQLIAEPIGFTKGYGTLHLSDLYSDIRQSAKNLGYSVRGGYGVGPKIRWQVITHLLNSLGLPGSYLKHGLRREVFLFRLVDNLEAYMAGQEEQPCYRNLPAEKLAEFWRERWLLPRSQRVNHWPHWQKDELFSGLLKAARPEAEANDHR